MTGNASFSSSTSNGDAVVDENRTFSHIINKKFSEFMGRKTNQSPPILPISIYSNDSGMNLDHINAVDAQSISSGNRSENDEDANIRNKSNSSLSAQENASNHRNRSSVSALSEALTDLP